MNKILVVYGTRPECIKLAPLIKLLKQQPEFKTTVISTGQHTNLLSQTEKSLNLVPDLKLNIGRNNQTLTQTFASGMSEFNTTCLVEKPDLVIVQGDTSTAVSVALAAFYLQISVAHVEAGLRTGNLNSPFPEEANRKIIDHLSTLLFPPTDISSNNLKNEGIIKNVYVVGNTIVDAFNSINLEQVDYKPPTTNPFILVTCHRRENFGLAMENIMKAVIKLSPNIDIVITVHPNQQVQKSVDLVRNLSNIHLVEPLNYLEFLKLAQNCKFSMSDSGGLAEESSLLHKPILILRDTTERPEVINCGAGLLVGTNTDDIYNAAMLLISNEDEFRKMSIAKNPFGDGTTSLQIVDILKDFLN